VEITSQTLIIVNDGPYGSERPYNALRLALALGKRDDPSVTVFLVGDAVQCAVANQNTPDGYYNVARMMKGILRNGRVYT